MTPIAEEALKRRRRTSLSLSHKKKIIGKMN
jgi:hypothetical protein